MWELRVQGGTLIYDLGMATPFDRPLSTGGGPLGPRFRVPWVPNFLAPQFSSLQIQSPSRPFSSAHRYRLLPHVSRTNNKVA